MCRFFLCIERFSRIFHVFALPPARDHLLSHKSSATMALTVKQEAFCNKHIECGNASEAYRHAYDCANMREATINNSAYKLLKSGEITARLQELQASVAERSTLKRDDIVRQLADVILSDITDFVSPDGSVRASEIKKMPKEKRRLIESIQATKDGVKLTLMSKASAIERLCKMAGWDAPTQWEGKITNELERYTDAELEIIANGE